MTAVVGIFKDRDSTEEAIDRLIKEGVDRDDIGVAWRDKTVRQPEEIETAEYQDHFEDAGSEAGKGAVGGAVGGAATGAGTILLASAGIALLPGIGALLAAGALAATAAGAAAGAVGGGVTGGILGALFGASDHDATKVTETQTRYRDVVERDGFVVTIDTDDSGLPHARSAMEAAEADEITMIGGDGSTLRSVSG